MQTTLARKSGGASLLKQLPLRMHHHAFVVRDHEANRHFFEDILGIPLVATWCEKNFNQDVQREVEFCHTFFAMADGSALAFFQFADAEMYQLCQAERPAKVGFYDHMLEQIATHGGFSLSLACEGDLHIDPHHVVEDCALALGAALKTALGDKRGIGRFGFVLPMDEAQAQISIDLGGRPFAVFEGSFRDARIGDYPTEMTAHVFRSLAEAMGAAIHVKVEGENDHHKTEACFKALGRALRQAIRIEGSDIPSTKGVI